MAMSFIKVYFDFEERTEELNDVERGRLLLTMLRYAQGKKLPELKGNERFLFPVFKAEIDREKAVYNTKVSNGAKGGRPTQKTEDNLTKPDETEDNLNRKNKNKNKTEEQEQEQERLYGLFTRFWAVYPRKEAKKKALEKWNSLKIDDATAERIIANVTHRLETEWSGKELQYIPHPTTYLNQRRWEDETESTARVAAKERVYADEDDFY